MKRIVIIIFLFLQTLSLVSQARFNRIYRLDTGNVLATVFFSMRIAGNKIYTSGTNIVPLDSTSGRFVNSGILTQFDLLGNIVKNNYYRQGAENCFFYDDVMVIDRNRVNLIGMSFESSITYLATNYNGDEIIRKKYYPTTFPTTAYSNPASMVKFGNGYALTAYNAFFTRTPTQASVIIIDTLGSIIKTFDFEAGRLNCGPGAILMNKNKNLTFSTSQFQGNDTDSGYVYVSKIREIDSSGTTLWSYSTPASRYIICTKFAQLANGNYLIWGTEELARIEFNGTRWVRQIYGAVPYIAEISPQRGLVWERKFQLETGSRLQCLKILRDSSIVLTGAYDDGFYSTSAFLIRLNSRGDSIYRRNFKTPEFVSDRIVYYPNQIEELLNGDLLIGGYLMNNRRVTEPGTGQWGWLVRTDSLGCSLQPSSCRVATKEIENGPLSINVFPNPVSAQLTVDYAFTELPKDATLQITDILGRTVYRQKMVNKQGQIIVEMATLQTGLYLASVHSEQHILWQTKVAVQR